MKILHVTKRSIPYLNDDEGSISDAFRLLGHEVVDILEENITGQSEGSYDVSLFHHWYDGLDQIPKLPGKKVLWYFDHVEFTRTCPELAHIKDIARRPEWVNRVAEIADYIFMTDGDYAQRNGFIWLPQGADHRLVSKALESREKAKRYDVLYVGSRTVEARETLVEQLSKMHPRGFRYVNGIYRDVLMNMVRKAKVVVCPDVPVTPNYWSNRLFVMCGFGACVLHPFCEGISNFYEPSKDVLLYQNRDELYSLIDEIDEAKARDMSLNALSRTQTCNTYVQRCEQLIDTIERTV